MSQTALFNNVQKMYFRAEKSLSPTGESDTETPKYNKNDRKNR